MKTLSALLLFACALQATAGLAHARHDRAVHVSWTCDMDGLPASLEAHYEAFDRNGASVSPVREAITSEIAEGTTIVFYEGRLTAPDRTYVFTGEDHIAEFTDLATLDRFLVHVLRTGDTLTLTPNPNDAGTSSYNCTLEDSVS